ncbi:hypothetical protein D9M69_720740 [compost metagenome]
MVRKLSFGTMRSLFICTPAATSSKTVISDSREVSLISTAVWPSSGGSVLAKA